MRRLRALVTLPPSGSPRPAMMRRMVDFPAPLEPTSAAWSLRSRRNEMPLSTVSAPKCLVALRSWMRDMSDFLAGRADVGAAAPHHEAGDRGAAARAGLAGAVKDLKRVLVHPGA